MRRFLKAATITLIAVLCLFNVKTAKADTPAFSLFDTSGKYISLSDYRGQYVVLNFWAFWCDTWKHELPSLIDLYGDEPADHFKLLAISVDGTRLPVFEHNTAGQNIPFPVLLDTGSTVSKAYNVAHVPTVIILDPSGKVRFSTYGYPGNHVLLSELRKIESSGQ